MSRDFYCLHSDLCKTLASEKRQRILGALRHDELPVSRIAETTGMTQANTSQHLTLLRSKGVVRARREGKRVYYAITDPRIVEAFDLITEVLHGILDSQRTGAEPAAMGTDPEPGFSTGSERARTTQRGRKGTKDV